MNHSETKSFHIGDILSVTTGCLASKRGLNGVYEILNWMTGESLMTHQLPRAIKVCQPVLRQAFPWSIGIQVVDTTGMERIDKAQALATWLKIHEEAYGARHEVPRLLAGTYMPMHPVDEIEAMLNITDGPSS